MAWDVPWLVWCIAHLDLEGGKRCLSDLHALCVTCVHRFVRRGLRSGGWLGGARARPGIPITSTTAISNLVPHALCRRRRGAVAHIRYYLPRAPFRGWWARPDGGRLRVPSRTAFQTPRFWGAVLDTSFRHWQMRHHPTLGRALMMVLPSRYASVAPLRDASVSALTAQRR